MFRNKNTTGTARTTHLKLETQRRTLAALIAGIGLALGSTAHAQGTAPEKAPEKASEKSQGKAPPAVAKGQEKAPAKGAAPAAAKAQDKAAAPAAAKDAGKDVAAKDAPVKDTAPGYPNKPIRIIVPNPAGGSADLMPRLITEALGNKLGQPVTVDNRAGAAGNIGAEYVYNSTPDGYTLLAAPPPPLTVNLSLYPKLSYDSRKFEPITVIAVIPNVLMLHPDVPLKSVPELIAYAKANPDKLSYASQGSGSTAHLTAELFKLNAHVNLTHIPYKGDAPALTDLLAGRVDMMFGNIGAFGQHVKAGKLKVIAVTSKEPLAVLPGVPTVNQFVPGVISAAWFGMVAPPKTPKGITQKLSATIAEILRQPEMVKRFEELNAEPVGNTTAQMATYMKEDRERWAAVIKAGKIVVD